MIVYKYVTSAGDDVIRNLRVKVTSPRDFNDPFELLPVIEDVTSEQVEQAALKNDAYLQHLHEIGKLEGRVNKPYDQFKQETQKPERSKAISKTIADGVAKSLRATAEESRTNADKIALMACFCGETTDAHHEILMWAHYAEAYKGLRIAIDSDFLHSLATPLLKMEYSKDRLRLNPINYWENGVQAFHDIYRRTLTSKSAAWAYENEYRWLVHLALCKKDGQHSYAHINSKAIVGVDCGVQCSPWRISSVKDLVRRNLGESVSVRKAIIDDYEFKLKYIDC